MEIDNRGSHFYLALYWAQTLAEQGADVELAERFKPLASALADKEEEIMGELNGVQGKPVDIRGYYSPDPELAAQAMRPSATLNGLIDSF
jgi:isocitrate dehydrogenase